MKQWKILRLEAGRIQVKREDGESFTAVQDEYTRDWAVWKSEEGTDQIPRRVRSKQDAISYALLKLDLLDDADVEFAPDRTSA